VGKVRGTGPITDILFINNVKVFFIQNFKLESSPARYIISSQVQVSFITMPLQSDITINFTKFDPKSVSEKTKKLNEHLIKIGKTVPNWWDVGALRLLF
jgi:hypothetical protein